jgi:hypothetical protein
MRVFLQDIFLLTTSLAAGYHKYRMWIQAIPRRSRLKRYTPVRARRYRPRRCKPARDENYKAWIRLLPCVACKRPPLSDPAHTGRDGGGSQKASDYSCVPLCRRCHDAYHRIGRKAFERRKRISFRNIVARLNEEYRRNAK